MGATEGSLNFERDPDPETVRVGKHLWKLDIASERIKEAITPLREAVDKLRGVAMAQPAKDQGPVDYDQQDDDIRRLASILERLSRPSYNNGGGDDSNDIKKWIAGLGLILTGGFIVGAWTVSNKVSAQTVQIENLTDQTREQSARITRIEQQINERR